MKTQTQISLITGAAMIFAAYVISENQWMWGNSASAEQKSEQSAQVAPMNQQAQKPPIIDERSVVEAQTLAANHAKVTALLESPPPANSIAPAKLAILRRTLSGVEFLVETCDATRVRDVTSDCIALVRSSETKINGLLTAMDSQVGKSTPGSMDLGMALILSKFCCDCDAEHAKLCTKVRLHLASARVALR